MVAASSTGIAVRSPSTVERPNSMFAASVSEKRNGSCVTMPMAARSRASGMVRTVNIQTTEKIYYTVEAVATGPSGHGSVPLPEVSVTPSPALST